MSQWIQCQNEAAVLTVGVRIIPKIEEGTTKHIKCEEIAYYCLKLSRFGAL